MRYLIVKTSAFGDVVHAFPVLHFLKEKDPEATVDWVVEKKVAPLVACHPEVDRVIEVDMKKWKKALFSKNSWREFFAFKKELQSLEYDLIIDLQGNMKSALITKLARGKEKIGFGYQTASEALSSCTLTKRYNPPKGQNIRADYLFIAQSHLQRFGHSVEKVTLKGAHEAPLLENAWLICPHSAWINKQLDEETLISFLQKSHAAYKPIFYFLSGSDSEKKLTDTLKEYFPDSQMLHKPSFSLLQQYMKQCELVLSMDSLPLHLAGTTEARIYSFFGPSLSQKYAPIGARNSSFQGICPYGRTFEKRCPILRTCKTGACLRHISAETLFAEFSQWKNKLDPRACP